MNNLLRKVTKLLLGLSLAAGVGVAIGSKAAERVDAEDEVYKTVSFSSSTMESSVSSYTATWTNTSGGFSVELVNFNNNNKGWNYVKTGNKSSASVGTITTVAAIDDAITKVDVTIDGITATNVNSIKLYSSNNGTTWSEEDTFTKATGTQSGSISSPTANLYYKIEFDCKKGSSNGLVTVSKIEFYHVKSANSKYTVTYDLNGGSGTNDIPEDNTEYSSGATVTVLGIGDVIKTGYSFINWSDGTNTYDEDDTFEITANVTLTAQWYHDDVISVVSGKENNTLYDNDTLNLSTCVTATGDGTLSFTVPSVNYLSYDAETTTVTADATNTGGPLTITAYKGNASCSFTVTVVIRPATGTFELFSGSLEAGEYVVVTGTTALKAAIASNTNYIDYDTVTITDDKIVNPSSELIWKIEESGDYWTLYNEENSKYAASTGAKNKGQVLSSPVASGDVDKTLWTVSGSSTYEFVNKQNTANSVNANLRYNNGYGYACYGTGTGSALTLYKKAGATVSAYSVSVQTTESGSTLSLPKGSSGSIASILSATVYGEDGTTLATNQHVTWSCEQASGVITFDNSEKTYEVTGDINAETRIYATSEDGSIKSSNYVTLTVARPSMPYVLTPGTNGFSDSAETQAISWTNSTMYTDVYYLGVHFNMAGGGNSGQYNSNTKTWRMYQTNSTVLTVTVPLGQTITKLTFTFNISNTGALYDSTNTQVTSGSDWTPASECQSAAFHIGNTGNATNGQVQFNSIAVTYAEATNPSVTIDDLLSDIDQGATGTFTAETAHATNPSVSWSSSDSTIIRIDNSSTGAYTAVGYGDVTITATLTCNEGGATDTLNISVGAGLITIADANTIAAALSNNTQTQYRVTISGYITNLNADSQEAGSERALMISNKKVGVSDNAEIEVFGVYNGASSMRNYSILNGVVSYKGYLKHYYDSKKDTHTYELVSPQLISYEDDAMTFARTSYNSLTATCEAYGAQGVTASQWTALSEAWDDVDSYSKTKLQAATSSYEYSDDIAHWIARYTIIVQSGKADFMQLGISSGARTIIPAMNENTNTIAAIVIISLVSVTAIGGYFFIKRREEN